MKLAYEVVKHAEDMYSCFDEAMSSIKSAIEMLKSANDCTADGFVGSLSDILADMEEENSRYDEILEESDRQEKEEMVRQYWRAVI